MHDERHRSTVRLVDDALTMRFGPQWRTVPLIGAAARVGDGELSIDQARNHLREAGFEAAVEAVRPGPQSPRSAAALVVDLWRPADALVGDGLYGAVTERTIAGMAGGSLSPARAALEALVTIVAIADPVLLASTDGAEDPVVIAELWVGPQRLFEALVARSIAGMAEKFESRYAAWEPLGAAADRDAIGLVGRYATTAATCARWLRLGGCACRTRGRCTAPKHQLVRWTPGGPPLDRAESPQPANLDQWVSNWVEGGGGPNLPTKAVADGIFYRTFLRDLSACVPTEVRIEQVLVERCVAHGCRGPVWRQTRREPARSGAHVGDRYCKTDRDHALDMGRLTRDLVFRRDGTNVTGHANYVPYGAIAEGPDGWCFEVGSRRRAWLPTPHGPGFEGMVARTIGRPDGWLPTPIDVPRRCDEVTGANAAATVEDPHGLAQAFAEVETRLEPGETMETVDPSRLVDLLIEVLLARGQIGRTITCDACDHVDPDLPYCRCVFEDLA